YAYATPTESALDLLSDFVPGGVVEVGSGTGYWAKLLRDRRVEVLALDKNPPDHQANAYHGRCRPHTEVKKGNATDLESLSPMEYPKLMLCYPPPQEHMAAEAIGNFKGDYVFHIGEWFGDTGSLAMQKALGQSFRMIRREPLPNWPSTSYEMTIWKRRSKDDQGENALPAVACSHCGGRAQVRCRITCEIAYCNKEECLDACRSKHRTLMAFKMSGPATSVGAIYPDVNAAMTVRTLASTGTQEADGQSETEQQASTSEAETPLTLTFQWVALMGPANGGSLVSWLVLAARMATNLADQPPNKKTKIMTAQVEQLAIDTIRVTAAEMVQKAKSGHPGAPM
ncbi:hypothetical protein FOZ63_007012, partial [Perkinsus olseni]